MPISKNDIWSQKNVVKNKGVIVYCIRSDISPQPGCEYFTHFLLKNVIVQTQTYVCGHQKIESQHFSEFKLNFIFDSEE